MGRYIVTDPRICHGQPTFRGTRILVSDVLEQVATGMAWKSIVEPKLESDANLLPTAANIAHEQILGFYCLPFVTRGVCKIPNLIKRGFIRGIDPSRLWDNSALHSRLNETACRCEPRPGSLGSDGSETVQNRS